jgi:hypothetical protein
LAFFGVFQAFFGVFQAFFGVFEKSTVKNACNTAPGSAPVLHRF